eukprot:TRINITY_DN8901_c0_g1_i2.p1 TRINITY_DN8901_c0_g1~~TRINITY_DN8901_c0_g1_i2.p1  ORF type:complete len:103 (+),score=32.62 TRINITY_DN8901_c0_g1_i2:56-364(+)
MTSKAKSIVEGAGKGVVVFSKTTCPFCSKTKDLFAELKVPITVYELNQQPDGAAVQNELLEWTKQRTVPNVFVAGQHVGGNDDVHAAHRDGRLKTMLTAAGL